MAKKDNISDVLERHGVRYFVALATVFYALGTIIFNVYLRKLGSFEFDLLQLRYMFVGLAFVLITAIFPLLVLGAYGIIRLIKGPEKKPSKSLTPGQRSKITRARHEKKALIFRRWRLGFFIALPFWLAFYAWNIFPVMPSGFGGARPYAARLIGSAEAIQKINDQIAFEASVDVDKLPFEEVPGKSGLTTGANVLILDKSDSRIFLLLTKDLYLSSTSNFAKKMIDLGEIPEDLEEDDANKFQVKPLIVSAEGIEGITLSLYEPPAITTTEDLQLAAKIVAADPEAAQAVTDAISSELPGVGEKIVAAVKEHQKTNPVKNVTKPSQPVVKPEISLEDVITEVITESVDTRFLDFRALAFSQAGNLITIEHRNGQDDERRRQLIQTVTKNFEEDFPESWAKLDPVKNFLATGQNDPKFPQKVQAAFRGAESADMVMNRLNTTAVEKEDAFPAAKEGALNILQAHTGEDTADTRALLATQLIKNFNDTAPENRESWESTYVTNGVEDPNYLTNLNTLFADTSSWNSFSNKSTELMDAMNTDPEPTCSDEIQNGEEEGIDCGGNCDACPVPETCEDGILNQDETEIDCGGTICEACVVVEPEVPAETCSDEIQNQDETDVDCGGVCDECSAPEPDSCEDGILNQDEIGIDCGGTICEACVAPAPEPTCSDEIQNGDETGVDCGGTCEACPVLPTCTDGILNQDETEIDCGGTICDACVVPNPEPTCTDEMQNGDETGVDCGGSCDACPIAETCSDGIQNQDETEIDCGGVCEACAAE